MPTKNPWISTASGGASPNAWNAAHSTAIWNAQKSDRAEQRRVARAQVARSRRARPPRWRAGRLRELLARAGRSGPGARATRSTRRCRSGGTNGERDARSRIITTPTTAGTKRERERIGALNSPQCSPKPQTIDGERVREVGQDEERDRLVGDARACACPRAAAPTR